MAALSKSVDYEYTGDVQAHTLPARVAASAKIYRGAVVSAKASAGGACPNAGDLVVMGIAQEEVDNSAGAAGARTVSLLTGGLVRITGLSGFAETDIGAAVYTATDNLADVTKTATSAAQVGIIWNVFSASEIEVAINCNRS